MSISFSQLPRASSNKRTSPLSESIGVYGEIGILARGAARYVSSRRACGAIAGKPLCRLDLWMPRRECEDNEVTGRKKLAR